jgi:hypothetical protein
MNDKVQDIEYKGFRIRRLADGSMSDILTKDGRGKVPMELRGLWTDVPTAKKKIDVVDARLKREALEQEEKKALAANKAAAKTKTKAADK